MISDVSGARVLHEDLDTSFVNLWGLLRYLSQRQFVGRVHVRLENYEADVFLDDSSTPLVHEIDRAAGTDVIEEAALHRLVATGSDRGNESRLTQSSDVRGQRSDEISSDV